MLTPLHALIAVVLVVIALFALEHSRRQSVLVGFLIGSIVVVSLRLLLGGCLLDRSSDKRRES